MLRTVWRLSHISQDTNATLILPSHILTENIKAIGRNFLNYHHLNMFILTEALPLNEFSHSLLNKMIWSSFLRLLHAHSMQQALDLITAFFTSFSPHPSLRKILPLNYSLPLSFHRQISQNCNPSLTAFTSSPPTHYSNSSYLASSQVIRLKPYSTSPSLMINS